MTHNIRRFLALSTTWAIQLVCCSPVGAQVRINEVLANNASLADGGIVSDWIELFNAGTTTVDLSNTSLSDTAATPRRFIFPGGSIIGASSYLLVRFDPTAAASATNTGFGLKASGGSVYLFDKPANGGAAIDFVSYGLQAADFSIGRTGSGDWTLNAPSPRRANAAAALGTPTALKVNEWMADNKNNKADYFEIYNAASQPVALSGLTVTDDLSAPSKHTIPPLSFIGTGPLGAYTLFIADGTPSAGADHVGFSLRTGGESLGIYDRGAAIDNITFGAQSTGVSEGRFPDGSSIIARFDTSPSPGSPNRFLTNLTEM